MYHPSPFGYAPGAPGLAPGLSAPSGGGSSLLPANFNFNAPVIHFGQTLSGATTISTPQPSMLATPIAKPVVAKIEGPRLPPSNEDILHAVFIGNIPDDLSDEWMERIARSLGKLKEWRRATDGSDKSRSFGFAIFQDAESTNRAFQILQSIEIPETQLGKPGSKLNVKIDETTLDYLGTLGLGQGAQDTNTDLDIRAYLATVLEKLKNPEERKPKQQETQKETTQPEGPNIDEADYIPNAGKTVLVGGDDNESNSTIPTAQREIILKEISAFRERSNRRERKFDLAELEKLEGGKREESPAARQGSTEPTRRRDDGGRKGSDAGIPSGPAAERRRGKDYIKFRSGSDRYDLEDEENIPDDQIERRRLEKKQRDLDAEFYERERKWLSREKIRTSALEREMNRAKKEDRYLAEKENLLKRLANFDDDVEAALKSAKYYKDHTAWRTERADIRRREQERDTRDREAEKAELSRERNRFSDMADSFLSEMNVNVAAPQPLRLRMTRENVKTAPASPAKRSVDEVEGLLEEDEEDEFQPGQKKRRMLVRLDEDHEVSREKVSREDELHALVQSIPADTKGLWEYPVSWDVLDNTILENKIRPFATKKIIEAFGVQEQELVDFVVNHISKHGSAEDLAKELDMTLEDEAELFVKKMWRMLILETESKKRKIST